MSLKIYIYYLDILDIFLLLYQITLLFHINIIYYCIIYYIIFLF